MSIQRTPGKLRQSIDLDRWINMHTHHTRHGLADQAITTDPRSHTPVVLLTLTLDSALEHGRPHAIVQPQAHARYTQRVPPPRPHRRRGAGMASRHMPGPLCSVRGARGAWSLAGARGHPPRPVGMIPQGPIRHRSYSMLMVLEGRGGGTGGVPRRGSWPSEGWCLSRGSRPG